jgi:hypothetical protein
VVPASACGARGLANTKPGGLKPRATQAGFDFVYRQKQQQTQIGWHPKWLVNQIGWRPIWRQRCRYEKLVILPRLRHGDELREFQLADSCARITILLRPKERNNNIYAIYNFVRKI